EVIQGPEFPTVGVVKGIDGLRKAYETAKGRIVVRDRARIESLRGSREQIVIDEIPYDVKQENMDKKIAELRHDQKVEGIAEIRDETDRMGLRVVIELKKGVNSE